MAKKPAGVKYDRKTRQTAEEMYGEHARKTGRDVMEIFEERKERWQSGPPTVISPGGKSRPVKKK